MQIIIGQAEIEQAITAHVLQMVAINPGQNIEIELKATRGEVGYQAFITIGEKLPSHPVVPVAKVAPVATNKVPSTPAEVRQMMAAEAAQEEATATPEEAPAAAEEETEQGAVVDPDPAAEVVIPEQPVLAAKTAPRLVKPQVVAEPVAEQVGGSDTPPPRKLFGGFAKPKN